MPEKLVPEHQFATAPLVYTCDCSLLYGIARAIQGLCIQNTDLLVAEAYQNSNCFVSQPYFVASELRPTVVFIFVLEWPRGSHCRLLPMVSF